MQENDRSSGSPLQSAAQAAQTVKGAIKTGKAIASASKGAAVGGVWGAAAGLLWDGRKVISKIIIASAALLMIPVLIVCMLPLIIFGGFDSSESSGEPILNDNAAIMSNLDSITTTVNYVMSEALNETLSSIDNDFSESGADGKDIINPYSDSSHVNVDSFIGQYCAAMEEDYEGVSLSDMKSMIWNAKDELYSYKKKEETRTVTKTVTTVTIDPSTGEEISTDKEVTVTETWLIYTVVYNGEEYFADEVFHLTDEQKELADDYAENLTLFLAT